MPTPATMTVNPTAPFDFELSAMIFSDGDPQIRKYEKRKFWQVIRVNGKLLLATVTSVGRIEEPKLSVKLTSDEKMPESDREEAEKIIRTLFNLGFDLKPFYEQLKEDSVMAGLAHRLRGLKSPTTSTFF